MSTYTLIKDKNDKPRGRVKGKRSTFVKDYMLSKSLRSMSELSIKRITTKGELKDFVRFNYTLYKDCPYAVPDMLEDTLRCFNAKSNAAFEFCEADCFLAYRDGKIVGRVAAIINNRANQKWNTKTVRFGWIDFIDDREVSKALLNTVERWGQERGMDTIVGPLGFTDMDPEGMLYEGYDKAGSIYTIYNYPYYNDHMEALGYNTDAVWLDRTIHIPRPEGEHAANQQKFFRVAKLVQDRYGFKVHKFKSKKDLRDSGYILKLFSIINTAYKDLYGYSNMTQRQMEQYAAMYLPLLNTNLLSVVENKEGTPIAVGVCMPNLTKAVQKAKSKFLPFGWWHILKALYWRHSNILDLVLIGTLPEYRDSGCISLMFADLIPTAQRMGFDIAECCPQLETNSKALSVWRSLDSEVTKKRHTWKKDITIK